MPEIIINGPEGRLEGRYHHADRPGAPLALLLHPHPQLGGTMNNKVLYNLFQLFVRHGCSVLRFNFRGVGRSQGAFSRGDGELSDAATALDWMQTVNPDAGPTWVTGFSFGAWIGMQLLMRRPEIERFIAVAPPAGPRFDFSFLAPCPSSGLVVHGEADEVVSLDSVKALVARLSKQRGIAIDHRMIPGANHYFVEHLDALEHVVDGYITEHLVVPAAA